MPATRRSKRKRDQDEAPSSPVKDDRESSAEAQPAAKKRRRRRPAKGARKTSKQTSPVAGEESSTPSGPVTSTLKVSGASPSASTSTLGSDPPRETASLPDPSPPSAQALEVEMLRKQLQEKEDLLGKYEEYTKSLVDLSSCHICMEVMDDPMTLHCGHTFCKYCLWECFTRHVPDPNEAVQGSDQEEYATADEGQEEGSATPRPTTQHPEAAETQEGGQEATLQLKAQRRHNLFCPSCRFRLYERPLPAFGLRDMIQSTSNHLNALNGSFTNTALQACVPSGERCKAPAMDDTWNGLFPQSRGRRHRGLKDEADNVVRCLHCNWEIYEATCESCGAYYSDFEEMQRQAHGDSDGSHDEEEEEEGGSEMDDFLASEDEDHEPHIRDIIGRARRHNPPYLTSVRFQARGQDDPEENSSSPPRQRRRRDSERDAREVQAELDELRDGSHNEEEEEEEDDDDERGVLSEPSSSPLKATEDEEAAESSHRSTLSTHYRASDEEVEEQPPRLVRRRTRRVVNPSTSDAEEVKPETSKEHDATACRNQEDDASSSPPRLVRQPKRRHLSDDDDDDKGKAVKSKRVKVESDQEDEAEVTGEGSVHPAESEQSQDDDLSVHSGAGELDSSPRDRPATGLRQRLLRRIRSTAEEDAEDEEAEEERQVESTSVPTATRMFAVRRGRNGGSVRAEVNSSRLPSRLTSGNRRMLDRFAQMSRAMLTGHYESEPEEEEEDEEEEEEEGRFEELEAEEAGSDGEDEEEE